MALQKTMDLTAVFGDAFGDVTNAYIFVEDIHIKRNNPGPGWTAFARLTIWTNKADKDSGDARPLHQVGVEFSVPGTLPTTDLLDWTEDQIIANATFTGATKISD